MSWEPRGPGGNMEDPFVKLLQEFQKMLRQRPGGPIFKGWKTILLLVVIGIFLWKGFYIVAPDEQGIVLRFGRLTRVSAPGPHLKIPLIEDVLLPKVTKLHSDRNWFSYHARRNGTDGSCRGLDGHRR